MYKLFQKDSNTRARLGTLKTFHDEIQTPFFMPVGTNATVKGLDSNDLLQMESQIVLSNTYHLYLRPGMDVIKAAGGTTVVCPVGHTYVQETMARERCILAGETSMHYYFPENYSYDDGLFAGLRFCELVANNERAALAEGHDRSQTHQDGRAHREQRIQPAGQVGRHGDADDGQDAVRGNRARQMRRAACSLVSACPMIPPGTAHFPAYGTFFIWMRSAISSPRRTVKITASVATLMSCLVDCFIGWSVCV